MVPPRKQVLFVHKNQDSESLSQSSGIERSRIFSHVQGQSSNPSERRRSSAPTSSATSEAGDVERESPGDVGGLGGESSRRATPSQNIASTYLLPLVQSFTSAPRAPPSAAAIDPFATTVIPMDSYVSYLLGFYNSSVIPRIFPARAMIDVSRHHTFEYATQDPVYLNALLCTASAALSNNLGNPTHDLAAMYYKGQSIHHLKLQLSDPAWTPSIMTVAAVSLLLWIEVSSPCLLCIQGSLSDVQAHVNGLRYLISQVENIEKGPLPVVSTIMSTTHLCAAMTHSRPVLPAIVVNDSELSNETAKAIEEPPVEVLNSMTSRFFTRANIDFVGHDLGQLISLQRYYIVFKALCSLGHLNPSYDDVQIVYTMHMSVENQLLRLPFHDSKPTLPPAQECVRLALFLFSQPILDVAEPSSAFALSVGRQLRASLERTDLSSLWGPNSDLLLWVLFITAHISRGHSSWPWVIGRIAEVLQKLRISTVEQLNGLLVGFYYLPEMFDKTLADVWQSAQQITQVAGVSG